MSNRQRGGIDRLRIWESLGKGWLPEQVNGRLVFVRAVPREQWVLATLLRSADVLGAPCDLIHASIAGRDALPSHADLTMLHRAVWGDDGYAYQVFAPREFHVNIYEHALHLWGAVDGRPLLPEFSTVLADGMRSV